MCAEILKRSLVVFEAELRLVEGLLKIESGALSEGAVRQD
jgi:hypothetical protein